MKNRKKILLQSLFLTVLIFLGAILINHSFDYFRINTIVNSMNSQELSSESFNTESFFINSFGGDKCIVISKRFTHIKEELNKVGEELNTYSKFSFFRRKDYDYLKRKYFLLELNFFSIIKKLNTECNDFLIPILFFYEVDSKECISQGFILNELSNSFDNQIIILSLDKNYEDEPLISLIKDYYNISKTPALIINEKKFEGLHYLNQLKEIITPNIIQNANEN